ncbi:response regulator [Leptothrix discophora]|uniref:Response regulator n=1 Tax=Leptothrix discophora TaxID=89 RepID=A0ABT9G7L8_LEPDI|nr:response regulator [Leptothrix discophora]MDP4302163.1 response regulator [Leptothrix discophora]
MGKTVMVIDDSSSFRTVVALALKRVGYDVVEASDGQDATRKLGGQAIDLLVCDVNMPGMDGLTFVRQLRTLPRHGRTPVVMLTTETSEAKKAEGRAAGANAWITKPFQPSKLVELVNSFFKE